MIYFCLEFLLLDLKHRLDLLSRLNASFSCLLADTDSHISGTEIHSLRTDADELYYLHILMYLTIRLTQKIYVIVIYFIVT